MAQQEKINHEQKEEEEIYEKQMASAHIVYEAVMREGKEELERSSSALAWSGLAAGLSMGFSLVAMGLLQRYLPDKEWRPLLVHLGYAVGFLIVILGRQQLFTENTLTPILPLMRGKDPMMLPNVLRLWGVVLATNVIGAGLFAWVLAKTNVFEGEVKAEFLEISKKIMEPSFWTVMLRAIFAGWLIALMVWLLPVAETGRIWIIVVITYLVGVGKLSHIIAGSAEGLYVVATGHTDMLQFLVRFFLPTLIGNIVGGVSLVAALNHAQVISGEE